MIGRKAIRPEFGKFFAADALEASRYRGPKNHRDIRLSMTVPCKIPTDSNRRRLSRSANAAAVAYAGPLLLAVAVKR